VTTGVSTGRIPRKIQNSRRIFVLHVHDILGGVLCLGRLDASIARGRRISSSDWCHLMYLYVQVNDNDMYKGKRVDE
jgi:hypothetical protein